MTRLSRASILLLLAILSCSPNVDAETLHSEVIVFAVAPVFESDEESRRIARLDLGCDPCQEIEDVEPDGTRAQYFLNPKAGVPLDGRVVDELGVESSKEGAVVFVRLNAEGQTLIRSLQETSDVFAANFVDGELIGLVPLRLLDSRYVIAIESDAASAERVRARIRR
jgi:hypothetical protein